MGYFGEVPTPSKVFEITSTDTQAPGITKIMLGIGGAVDDPTVSTVEVNGSTFAVWAGLFRGEAALDATVSSVGLKAMDAAGNTALRSLDIAGN